MTLGTLTAPCKGCYLATAPERLFETMAIDELIFEFCRRPKNRDRCCYWPEPPDENDEAEWFNEPISLDDANRPF